MFIRLSDILLSTTLCHIQKIAERHSVFLICLTGQIRKTANQLLILSIHADFPLQKPV